MQDGVMREWLETSHLAGGNVAYIEQMFEAYLDDPTAVSDEWRQMFDALPDRRPLLLRACGRYDRAHRRRMRRSRGGPPRHRS